MLPWITSSFLMFFSSVVLYLLVRKSTLLKTPLQFNNLAMFLIPLVVYSSMAVSTKASILVTPYQFLILLILGYFFSYLGNMASIKSIELAPNPGFSLIVSKSYVVFTTLVAAIVFNSELTLKAIGAIALIVAFSSLVIIDPKKNKKDYQENNLWFVLSLGAFFAWGMLSIASKYLLNMGVSILARLIISMTVVNVLILSKMLKNKFEWKEITKHQWLLFISIGLLGASFNYFMQSAFQTAPNIGYVNAINASSIAVVTISSGIFFKDELTTRKLLGVLGVIAGLVLLLV